MPELPEAENICRALKRVMAGRTITRVEVFTPAMREPLTPLLSAGLEGLKVVDVRRLRRGGAVGRARASDAFRHDRRRARRINRYSEAEA